MKGKVTAIAATAMLATQPMHSAQAQTRPAEPIQTLPAPERAPGRDRPVPLPQPVPNRPLPGRPDLQRPVPLPQPVPDRQRPRPPRADGFAGRVTCESRNNRTQRCNARTQNRVELLTRSTACVHGRSWGYDQRQIWVSRNCRGTFAYGRGNNWWDDRPGSSGGLSPGAIIGGVTVAAGLAAILGNRNNSRPSPPVANAPPPPAPPREPEMRPLPEPEPEPEAPPTPAGPFPPGPPATVMADLSTLPADSRPSMNTCLQEAARQVGVTGGTQVRFDRLVHIEPGNGGWRFRAQLIATYPDAERILPLFCRATPTRVVELDFRT